MRCTTRTAASGERSSAWVSSTLALLFAPVTMRFTTRRMTSLRIQLRMKAPMMMPATLRMFSPTSASTFTSASHQLAGSGNTTLGAMFISARS